MANRTVCERGCGMRQLGKEMTRQALGTYRVYDQIQLRSSDRMPIVTQNPTSVYRYYDERGVLLYVGITSRGAGRNREHNSSKEWWPFVARQDVEHYPTREAASRREVELIRSHRPPFNKQHNTDHATLRELYLAVGSAPAENTPERPIDLYRSLGKHLPLVPVDSCTADRLVLGTLAQHGHLVRRVAFSHHSVIFRAPKKRGRVEDVATYGDRLVLTITGRDLLVPPFRMRLKAHLNAPPKFVAQEIIGGDA